MTTALHASMGARLRARKLSVRANAVSIARALADRGLAGVALLHGAGGERGARPGASFVAAAPDRHSAALDPFDDDDWAPRRGGWAGVPRWIGAIPYEHRRTLEREAWVPSETRAPPWIEHCTWSRYPAVVRIDPQNGEVLVIGIDDAGVELLATALDAASQPRDSPPVTLEVQDEDDPDEHLVRVARARELIVAGDLYQVNVARRLRLALCRGDALALHERLIALSPAEHGGYIETSAGTTIVSTSPELLLDASTVDDGSGRFGMLTSVPIKGTRPRGRDAASDRALAEALDADPKERAELAMIVDVVLNDASRVCDPATVRVAQPARVRAHRTLHHRAATVVGRVRDAVDRRAVIEAMVPSGSVTGAPKVRAMEVIAELEAARRGLYTGGFGYVAHDGSLRLSMAIRTAVLRGGEGHYWTGGGIVVDSDPERELEETRVKALALAQLVNG